MVLSICKREGERSSRQVVFVANTRQDINATVSWAQRAPSIKFILQINKMFNKYIINTQCNVRYVVRVRRCPSRLPHRQLKYIYYTRLHLRKQKKKKKKKNSCTCCVVSLLRTVFAQCTALSLYLSHWFLAHTGQRAQTCKKHINTRTHTHIMLDTFECFIILPLDRHKKIILCIALSSQ